jgi:glycogen(starch) synthase
MKVLMFGWEFPPHISGGLGTACFGLTKALIKERIKVLFVVPRLFGDETGASSFLIDASAVSDIPRHATRKVIARSRTERTQVATTSHFTTQDAGPGSMTYLEVGSPLSPYETTLRHQTVARPGLSSWNYRMTPQHHSNGRSVSAYFDMDELTGSTDIEESAYTFSGTYGKNLMEEVKRYARVAGRIARDYSFDIIHVHDWMTFPAGIVAKEKSKRPLVVHVHSTEFDRSGNNVNKEIYDIEKLGFAEADKIVAVSKWTKQIVTSRYDVPEEKISVVHNGILPKDQGKPFDFPDIGSHFITFLGRVTHQKGPWFFVEAAQKVLQEFPDAHFIVAGAGDLLPQIIERVAQLNMSASFHFTGFLSGNQVDHIWSLTDVYVMPSVSEPFGIAPLEAIQGGVPVILSNQSGVAEVMPHAIKVDFWDTKALAAAICSVLRYESLSHVLRENSKQHIESLTWDKAAADVKALYHELRGKK